MTLEAKVCNYTGLSVKYIGYCLNLQFTPLPTSTQDVLAITLIIIINIFIIINILMYFFIYIIIVIII